MTERLPPEVSSDAAAEPWGPRLWLGVAVVAMAGFLIQSHGITTWPMADDEVPSLVEMGLSDIGAEAFSVPPEQVGRLPRALPVWYGFQQFTIGQLPADETSYRIPSLIFALLTSVLVFIVAARWRGLWFAIALSILLNLSPPFVLAAQLNRFYAMPLFLASLTLLAMWVPGARAVMLPAVAAGTILTVLSHNITIALFGLAFGAGFLAVMAGRAPRHVLERTALALAVSAIVYIGYLRPIVSGWSSTGNPTPILVSYAAHLGVPALALALLGAALVLLDGARARAMGWWLVIFAGSFGVFLVAQFNFNPRYFLFFFTAAWVLGAYAATEVARRLGHGPAGAAWYACVALLLLPSLFSHYQDGSRHDYRQAAAVLTSQARGSQPLLSDDAETIGYYLAPELRRRLVVRTKAREYPAGEFFLVARMNAWMPQPTAPGRRVDVIAEISRRRFDQFSHVLRVYRVAAQDVH